MSHTPLLCPLSVATCTRLGSLHSLMLLSWLAVASRVSLGLKASAFTSLSWAATADSVEREIGPVLCVWVGVLVVQVF